MYEITVRKEFRALHALRNYRGAGETLHEHLWRCEVSIAADGLDAAGCAADFADVDAAIDRAIMPIEGRSLNELFSNESPSAENVARYLHRALSESLNADGRRVVKVRIFEDENHSATYFE